MPDTNAFLYLGLAVIFSLSGLYVASLALRFRGAQKQIDFLTAIDEE
jgi:hypothetical protein